MKNTKQNKKAFFGIYINQKYFRDIHENVDGIINKVGPYPMYNSFDNIFYSMDTFMKEAYPTILKVNDYLMLKPLSMITDEDAFEVARIVYGESENFAIEFNAEGITSISLYGLPCYGNTIDINWSGNIVYEKTTTVRLMSSYDYLRSKGYALPWMGLSVEQQVQYGWIKLIEE